MAKETKKEELLKVLNYASSFALSNQYYGAGSYIEDALKLCEELKK